MSMRTLREIPWSVNRTVAPAVRVVGIDELKHHLRVTWDEENDTIEDIALAAEEAVERELSRSLTAQTWVLRLDQFPCYEMSLPRPAPKDGPFLTSVTSVQYVDENGATQTLSGTIYTVDTTTDPGRIYLAYNQAWPTTRTIPNAVIATYVAGLATGEAVPELIRTAIKLTASDMYLYRERSAADVLRELTVYDRLVISHRCLTDFIYR